MLKKIFLSVILACTAALFFAGNVLAAGWIKDNKGWWYKRDDGSYPKSEWFEDRDGKWYFFNPDGYMYTNTLSDDGYWLGNDGAWQKGKTVNIDYFTNTFAHDSVIKTYDRYFLTGKARKFDNREITVYFDTYTKIPRGATIYNNTNRGNGYTWFDKSYYADDLTALNGVYDIDVKDGHVEVLRDVYWWD